jgi:hypothetical protein
MKRFLVFLVIAFLIAGMVSAQPIIEQRNSSPRAANEWKGEGSSVTVDGVLKLEKGFVAVESANNVYIVPMLSRYIGFITDLREGAKVSVEGYEFKNMIRPTKVTIEGKSYDFTSWDRGRTSGFGRQDFRSDNDRRAPTPYWNSQRHERRYGRGSCCRW